MDPCQGRLWIQCRVQTSCTCSRSPHSRGSHNSGERVRMSARTSKGSRRRGAWRPPMACAQTSLLLVADMKISSRCHPAVWISDSHQAFSFADHGGGRLLLPIGRRWPASAAYRANCTAGAALVTHREGGAPQSRSCRATLVQT